MTGRVSGWCRYYTLLLVEEEDERGGGLAGARVYVRPPARWVPGRRAATALSVSGDAGRCPPLASILTRCTVEGSAHALARTIRQGRPVRTCSIVLLLHLQTHVTDTCQGGAAHGEETGDVPAHCGAAVAASVHCGEDDK